MRSYAKRVSLGLTPSAFLFVDAQVLAAVRGQIQRILNRGIPGYQSDAKSHLGERLPGHRLGIFDKGFEFNGSMGASKAAATRIFRRGITKLSRNHTLKSTLRLRSGAIGTGGPDGKRRRARALQDAVAFAHALSGRAGKAALARGSPKRLKVVGPHGFEPWTKRL